MDIKPITVQELNKYIKQKIDGDEYLNSVFVKGEISNFKLHYTGHMYFTLKDENSLIKCIMFKGYTPNLKFMPKDGMKVVVFGSVSVFDRDGVYQIYCKAMREEGMGTLYEEYQKLKAKLEKEGLFEAAHKKKIPMLPKTIGVLTSSTGAVIRDIINVSTRRNPNVHIRLLPVPVQGTGAAEKIADAIEKMNAEKLADVIIIGRGGGSLEDLWPFNEEIVARAIYNSKLPIISAVGHETDFTIADFVSDLRAPTPSAAAELAVPNVGDLVYTISIYQNRYKVALKRRVQLMKMRYEKCMARRVFKEPLQKIHERSIRLDMSIKLINNSIKKKMQTSKSEYIKLVSKLDALSPLKTLARGYSIAENDFGEVISSKDKVNIGDYLSIRFTDGKIKAKVEEKNQKVYENERKIKNGRIII